MRSSRLWPGSTSMGMAMAWSIETSTVRTERTSYWSATAAAGRLSGSSTSMVTRARSGSKAPRQRRGRNGLIGVNANSGAWMGITGPWTDKLYAVEPRGLIGFAENGNFVDGMGFMLDATHVAGAHAQRMDHGGFRCGDALPQTVLLIFVHEETDGATMHAVDRLARAHQPVQGLQHEAVTAERHDDVGALRLNLAVARGQPGAGALRLRARTRDEGQLLGSGRGAVHRCQGLKERRES